ncbi:MAG: CpaF family protein [Lachnospiraceae bacterium]|nr:CpaF family protein [Lachnospiraceae bacterium]
MDLVIGNPKELYGPLYDMIDDPKITDIDICNREVFFTDTEGRRMRLKSTVKREFELQFCMRIANLMQKNFNRMNPLLEAETDTLRISILHESVSMGGRSISIRKSLPTVRYTADEAINSGLFTRQTYEFLTKAIRSGLNFVICGEPGAGKTELAKFLASHIDKSERIITIEDNLEWHLKKFNPESDIVELKVEREEGKGFSYHDAIKASLRQNPKWLMLSETRGEETKYLIEAWSTGIHGITTIHTDDAEKIPERILTMIGNPNDVKRMENQIYNEIDIGMLIARVKDECGVSKRVLWQLRVFYREGGVNRSIALVDNGRDCFNILSSRELEVIRRKGIAVL